MEDTTATMFAVDIIPLDLPNADLLGYKTGGSFKNRFALECSFCAYLFGAAWLPVQSLLSGRVRSTIAYVCHCCVAGHKVPLLRCRS